jgi:hypothetical protein
MRLVLLSLAILAAASLAVGCRSSTDVDQPPHWPVREVLGPVAVDAVLRSERLECFRVAQIQRPSKHSSTRPAMHTMPVRTISDGYIVYEIVAESPAVSAAIRRDLARALLDAESYVRQPSDDQIIVPCFYPAVAYRFTRGLHVITVVVCLECEISRIVLTELVHGSGSRQSTYYVAPYSEDGVRRILAASKYIFSNDAEIQAFVPRAKPPVRDFPASSGSVHTDGSVPPPPPPVTGN